ncbi:MAG: hypothetical protein EOO91_18845, partial [Pedobacter sp.]
MKIIYLLLIAILLTSCLKRNEKAVNQPCSGNCITVNVRVGTDLNSVTPVSNANVELGWNRPATPIGDAGRLIAKGTTASDGKISFSFKAQEKELKDGQFYISVKKGTEYFEYHDGFYGVKKADSTLNLEAHIPSKANIKILFKDFNPKISTDYFSCSPSYKTNNYTLMGLWLYKANGQGTNPWFSLSDGAFTSLELSGVTAGNEYTYFSILKKINGT